MAIFDEDTPGWVRASVVLAVLMLIAVVGLVAFLVGGADGDGEAKEPTSSASPSKTVATQEPSPTASTETDSVCGLVGASQEEPTTAPQVVWDPVGAWIFPRSETDGPKDATKRTCFAHTPTGAVLYAFNYLAQDPSRVVTNEPGMQTVGFRITDSTRDRVSLDLAYRSTLGVDAGVLFSIAGVVEWRDGDWAFTAASLEDQEPVRLADLNGFVAFGPGLS